MRLESLTIAWMLVEANASVWAGIAAHSVLLIAFGADSVVELCSAILLLWRLRKEARAAPGDEHEIEAVERRVSRISGVLLHALAGYVVLQSGVHLLRPGIAPETSWLGIGVTAVAAVGMPLLAKAKLRIAAHIGSAALRADAVESLTCGNLSRIALAGLAANALLHWWWLDSVAALTLVPFLVKEGREALSGGCACADECVSPRRGGGAAKR
jgi:divalent metal cation (Fe/Co/Zn/Cd) transporter